MSGGPHQEGKQMQAFPAAERCKKKKKKERLRKEGKPAEKKNANTMANALAIETVAREGVVLERDIGGKKRTLDLPRVGWNKKKKKWPAS